MVARQRREQRAAPRTATRAAPSATNARHLAGNPWLRGVIMAPSVHASMDVTLLGPPNYRALQPLMHKPGSAIANVFAQEADFGLTSVAFSGSAVAFIPVIEFGRITAGLN
jgi:hypothetical protein